MRFERYLGIDYSGAQTATTGLKGLRLYEATPKQSPSEICPHPASHKYWTRRGLAEWLASELRDGPPTIVGIDHAFSFPLGYFEAHRLPADWAAFLNDFQLHWPTDEDHMCVDFIRDGRHGNGAARSGNARWRRMAEVLSRAKSVFHFDVPGSVAKSTHAGLPWLRYLRQQPGIHIHFWPFDGWTPPLHSSVITEIYPSLWNKTFPCEDRTPDQHDAYTAARWMQETDAASRLEAYFQPQLSSKERSQVELEGWILGVT